MLYERLKVFFYYIVNYKVINKLKSKNFLLALTKF